MEGKGQGQGLKGKSFRRQREGEGAGQYAQEKLGSHCLLVRLPMLTMVGCFSTYMQWKFENPLLPASPEI
jgi:hypothetical protein